MNRTPSLNDIACSEHRKLVTERRRASRSLTEDYRRNELEQVSIKVRLPKATALKLQRLADKRRCARVTVLCDLIEGAR